MTYVYLAEPIDRSPERHPMASSAAFLLQSAGVPFFSPREAWNNLRPPFDPSIQEVNNEALRHADVMLVIWPENHTSIGIPIEIQRAATQVKPIVFVSPVHPRHWSVPLASVIMLWFPTTQGGITGLAQVRETEATATPLPYGEAGYWVQHGEGGRSPKVHKNGDAGYDLYTSEDTVVLAGQRGQVPTDISVELPPGYWFLIMGRSSTWAKGLMVKDSVIDAGYRGKLWVDVLNTTPHDILVGVGDRIGQMVPLPLGPNLAWFQANELSMTERGDSGYGSTGA